MKKESTSDKLILSPALNAGTNMAAVLLTSFSPWAAMLPVLTGMLASERQANNIATEMNELNEAITQLKINVEAITDDQFKLVGECVVAMFSTMNPAKLAYLRQSVLNTLSNNDVALSNSEALGRLIRDISAEETSFIIHAFNFKSVSIGKKDSARSDRLNVEPDSRDDMIVGGLIRLGLLYTKSNAWDAQMYEWSPITAKFIALVKSSN